MLPKGIMDYDEINHGAKFDFIFTLFFMKVEHYSTINNQKLNLLCSQGKSSV